MVWAVWNFQYISNSNRHGGSRSELSGNTRNGYFGRRHKTTIHSRFSGWNIVSGYKTIQLHRFHAATECFAETTDTVCIPPHSEVMLWAKLKTNNGRRGPTAGVILLGILVGRSLVRADADDWKVPILLYNSDPCTKRSKD